MSAQKPGLHPRNRHHHRYDLATLCQVTPELAQFLTRTPAGEQSVDFANPLAVKALNKALLAYFYQVANWDIPEGFLCPSCERRFSGFIPASSSALSRADMMMSACGCGTALPISALPRCRRPSLRLAKLVAKNWLWWAGATIPSCAVTRLPQRSCATASLSRQRAAK